MNIAVFSDKFSGTLSAIEVLDIVQKKFLGSNIDADFFSVTDGGQESNEIFKSHNFQTHEIFEALNCDNSPSVVESLNINGSVFFESAQLIGIDSKKESLSINTGCLLEAVQKTEVLGTGRSKNIDFGGAGIFWTSPTDSTQKTTPYRPILSLVRPTIVEIMKIAARGGAYY